MIGGLGLIAYPADYGRSGVMSFMVAHDGVVYEKDLGRKTSKAARKLGAFLPDQGWQKVTETELPQKARPASKPE
jgi:Protein of unknown function (DUF2950)